MLHMTFIREMSPSQRRRFHSSLLESVRGAFSLRRFARSSDVITAHHKGQATASKNPGGSDSRQTQMLQ
jgi:hypothetical protein